MELFNACEYLLDRRVWLGGGDRVALRVDGRSLTYAELLERVMGAAAGLRALGIRPEDRVLLLLPDSSEFVTVFLAALRLGAIPVPLDGRRTPADLAPVAAESRSRVAVISSRAAPAAAQLAAAAPELVAVVVVGDDPISSVPGIAIHRWRDLFPDSGELAAHATWEGSPGFWLCTSDVTGRPKLVMHRHVDLRTTAEGYAREILGIMPADRCLSVAPMFHAYGLGNSLTFPLSVGATSILEPARPPGPEGIARLVQSEQPTLFFSVPTFYAALLAAEIPPDTFASVRLAVSAAEQLPATLYTRFRERFGVEILDGVGSTELTHIYLSNRPGLVRPGTSGTPVSGYRVRLEDEHGEEVPDDVPGMLLVAGAALATGYWERADETRERFRGEWFRSGDMYTRSQDGFYTYLGRADGLFKVSGEWVAPAEVEAVLRDHPGVLEAAIMGEQDADGLTKPVAFVVPASGARLDPDDVLRFSAGRLAGFKRPRRVTVVDQLPRTSTGTIERTKLRGSIVPAGEVVVAGVSQDRLEPDAGSSFAPQLLEAAEGDRERVLLDLVRARTAAVLGLASPHGVDPEQPFKEMGLDSVSVVELSTRLGADTGLRVPSTLLFDHATPAAVSAYLLARLAGRDAVTWAPVRLPAQEAEPIAIVGMACRYPGGVTSAEGLWQLVSEGREVLSEFPADRGWDLERLFDPDPDQPGTCYVRRAGFMPEAGDFDAEFFGISPREALGMDPQQRLFLEVVWEGLEQAGIDPTSLRGSPAGVFVGAMQNNYVTGQGLDRVPLEMEGLIATGDSISLISGRVAYFLGLEGPAVTIDTACSSALVAVHLACQALHRGDCSLALAGGVSVLATPATFIAFSRQRGLAPDGRCKSFGAAADGTNWGEGAGVVVLERLSEARRLGHRVLAVVPGSAVNQDGASNGLTAPSGRAQERVIQAALANAGLLPGEVDAVEGHGTGTILGDPIEARALLSTYGQHREDAPLWLGSIKSNLGHTLAAAGVAGLVKMVMALQRGELPRTLHVDAPNPHADWSAGRVELLKEAQPWLKGARPRRAGISSFGISGTNAHVILEEAPSALAGPASDPAADGNGDTADETAPRQTAPQQLVIPWLLSAKSERALRAQAQRLHSHLRAHPELDPVAVAATLASRSRMDHRAVVLGADRQRLLAGLAALGRSDLAAGVVVGQASSLGRTVFMFSGQGAQRPGMGSELYRAFPVFARSLDAICSEIDLHLDRSLRPVMFAAPGSTEALLLDRTEFTQPALFAFELALFDLLTSWGLKAGYLIGHSIGELTAACAAGVLSLPDACALVAARGRLMGSLPGGGAMVAVQASEPEVQESLAEFEEDLSIAAVNGPHSVVVAGDKGAAARWADGFRARGRKVTWLKVSHAFHSRLVDPMLCDLRRQAERLSYAAPRIPIISNLLGEPLLLEPPDWPDYWVRQARRPVRFAAGVRWLYGAGVNRFVELGPDGVLSALARESLPPEGEAEMLTVPAQRAGRPEPESLLECVAGVHVRGVPVDWGAMLGTQELVDLPAYAFQHRRYWLVSEAGPGDVAAAGLESPDQPLLGAAAELADEDEWLFTGRLSLQTHPWLADHVVLGTVLLTGTTFVELALAAGAQAGAGMIEEITLEAPLVIPERGAVQFQVRLHEPDASGRRQFAIHSRSRDPGEDEVLSGGEWTRHATGTVAPEADTDEVAKVLAAGTWPPVGAEPVDVEFIYDRLAEIGYGYGPAFQVLRAVWRRQEEVFAEVALAEEEAAQAGRFGIHPVLFDGAWHAGLTDLDEARLPFSWAGVRLYSAGARTLRVRIAPSGSDAWTMTAWDQNGKPVLSLNSLVVRPPDRNRLGGANGRSRDSLWVVEWIEHPLPSIDGSLPRVAVLGEFSPAGINSDRYSDLHALRAALDRGAPAPDVVLAFAPTSDRIEGLAGAAHRAARDLLALLQEWLADERLAGARLVLLTTGAAAARQGEVPELSAAALSGLMRSAQAEHPGRFVSIDLDTSDASKSLLQSALAAGEPEVALRDGVAYVPRLKRAILSPEDAAPIGVDPAGTVLITGAMGTLGTLLARHLARQGARRLLLVSRRGPDAPGVTELMAELSELGCRATVAACDVSDREQLRALIEGLPDEYPLTAVIHAAGVMDDGLIERLDGERLERVLQPKLDAALHLHELTQDRQLTEFLLFSSAIATLGSPGQGNYAAANTFLDALAAYRRARGLAGRSLAWGLWEQRSGMAGDRSEAQHEEMIRQIRHRLGMLPLASEKGLELFDLTRRVDTALVLPVRLDLGAVRAQVRAGTLPALLRGLVRLPAGGAHAGAAAWKRQLAEAPDGERETVALELVRAEAATVLGHTSREAVEPERPFHELGFDSLAGVDFRNRLAQATGLALPSTLVFDHPTAAAVARFLVARSLENAPAQTGETMLPSDGGTLTALLCEARERGELASLIPVLAETASFWRTFHTPAELPALPRAAQLTSGGSSPVLVCVPSFVAGSGVHQFARLARALKDERPVVALQLPGFLAGEPVPATWQVAVDVLAQSVQMATGGRSYVLLGYSIGGTLAHALAEKLSSQGMSPLALIRLDAYAPRGDVLPRLFSTVMEELLSMDDGKLPINDASVLGMATYMKLFRGWTPQAANLPSLLVRAAESLPQTYEQWQVAPWHAPYDVVEVPGNHFSIIEEHAEETARAIDRWLRTRIEQGELLDRHNRAVDFVAQQSF